MSEKECIQIKESGSVLAMAEMTESASRLKLEVMKNRYEAARLLHQRILEGRHRESGRPSQGWEVLRRARLAESQALQDYVLGLHQFNQVRTRMSHNKRLSRNQRPYD